MDLGSCVDILMLSGYSNLRNEIIACYNKVGDCELKKLYCAINKAKCKKNPITSEHFAETLLKIEKPENGAAKFGNFIKSKFSDSTWNSVKEEILTTVSSPSFLYKTVVSLKAELTKKHCWFKSCS